MVVQLLYLKPLKACQGLQEDRSCRALQPVPCVGAMNSCHRWLSGLWFIILLVPTRRPGYRFRSLALAAHSSVARQKAHAFAAVTACHNTGTWNVFVGTLDIESREQHE
uniref:Uncharacterized protein n=1 Tax=Rhipicephalus zambeziensis TaxID=60191 RepID=A0A224YAV8_9ACAR